MSRYARWLAGIVVAAASLSASAEIEVPEGFVVDTLLDQIDGTTPRLEAIRNSDYGFGVVAASVDNGILKVLRISESSAELLATMPGFPADSQCGTIRFDTTGLFNNRLHATVWTEDDPGAPPGWYMHTDILQVLGNGSVFPVASLGDLNNRLMFVLDFTTGSGGYLSGAYLEDYNGSQSHTSLYYMDTDFALTMLAQDLRPADRTDLDIRGMEFDPTGAYGWHLTMADSDPGFDDLTVIYYLLPDLSWAELTTPVNTSTRFYRDMSFSPGGSFGQLLYVTDRVTDTVMTIDTSGAHSVFASGFYEIESITVSDDGEHMFVSDSNAVYRIRAGTITPGPSLVMREPWVEADDVHTGPSGVDSLRLLWSERVLFGNSDLTVTNEDAEPVPFSVSGSNSQFMIIAFGEVLLNDEYTITISDSVVSAETGAAIDGDNDGLAGGDAVLVMEHRNPFDHDRDGDVDLLDFGEFQAAFTGP